VTSRFATLPLPKGSRQFSEAHRPERKLGAGVEWAILDSNQ
jgi:hypothetical protein